MPLDNYKLSGKFVASLVWNFCSGLVDNDHITSCLCLLHVKWRHHNKRAGDSYTHWVVTLSLCLSSILVRVCCNYVLATYNASFCNVMACAGPHSVWISIATALSLPWKLEIAYILKCLISLFFFFFWPYCLCFLNRFRCWRFSSWLPHHLLTVSNNFYLCEDKLTLSSNSAKNYENVPPVQKHLLRGTTPWRTSPRTTHHFFFFLQHPY